MNVRVVSMRHSDVEWARQWLEPGMRTVFAYVLKRNAEFGVDFTSLDTAEQYAVLRQQFTKGQIEKMFHVEFEIR